MAPAVTLAILLLSAATAQAQQPPACAASSETPRTADQVIAAVKQHGCPPGSQLRAAMTIAGQAIVLQMSGLCEPDTVRTRTWRPTPETRLLGFTCLIAAP